MNQAMRKEIFDHVREKYNLTLNEFRELINLPEHPHELRDDFAKVALQGILSTSHGPYFFKDPYVEPIIAENAYRLADAMLAARLGNPNETTTA
jgi:hypothetical protein